MEIDLTNAKPCADCRQCLTTAEKCSYCAERDQLRRELAEARAEIESHTVTQHNWDPATIPLVRAWMDAHPAEKSLDSLSIAVEWIVNQLAAARAQLKTASATNHEYAIAVIPAVGAWASAHPGEKVPKLDEIVSWVCQQLAEARDENRRSGDRLMEQMAIDGKLASELAKAEAKRDGYRAKMEEFEDKWATAEQQLAEARRDGEDLDWLEKVGLTTHSGGMGGEAPVVHKWGSVERGEWKWTVTYMSSEFPSIRAAIRAARGAK